MTGGGLELGLGLGLAGQRVRVNPALTLILTLTSAVRRQIDTRRSIAPQRSANAWHDTPGGVRESSRSSVLRSSSLSNSKSLKGFATVS